MRLPTGEMREWTWREIGCHVIMYSMDVETTDSKLADAAVSGGIRRMAGERPSRSCATAVHGARAPLRSSLLGRAGLESSLQGQCARAMRMGRRICEERIWGAVGGFDWALPRPTHTHYAARGEA